jgi:hypothetical protein
VVTDDGHAGWYTIPPLQEHNNRGLTPDPIPHPLRRLTQMISFVARCATPSTRKTPVLPSVQRCNARERKICVRTSDANGSPPIRL